MPGFPTRPPDRPEDVVAALVREPEPAGRRRQKEGPFLPVSPPLRCGNEVYLTGLQETVVLDAFGLEVTRRDDRPRMACEGAAVVGGQILYVDVHGSSLRRLDGSAVLETTERIGSPIVVTPEGQPAVGVGFSIQVLGGPTCVMDDTVRHVTISQERIVGVTHEGHVAAFDPAGKPAWQHPEKMTWPRVPAVFSPDSRRLYLAAEGCLVARDALSGEELWRLPTGENSITPPALDAAGNLHVYTTAGNVLRVSPEGELLKRIPTGTRYYVSMGYRAQLELDRLGNIVVTPNPDETMVFAPEGSRLMRLTTAELFDGLGEFVDSFALSPERDRVLMLSGSRGVTEVELPRTPAERADSLRAAIAARERPGPQVGESADWVTVKGVRLRRRRA